MCSAVTTSAFEHNPEIITCLHEFGFGSFPDADIKVGSLASGGGIPIEIKVSGNDPDELARISERIKLALPARPRKPGGAEVILGSASPPHLTSFSVQGLPATHCP